MHNVRYQYIIFLSRHHFRLNTNIVLMMSWNKSTITKFIIFHNWYHILNYFPQSFSLRVNKFIIQYFRSLFCFAGPSSESEFLIVFSFSFPVIQHSKFQASKLFINVPLQGPRVPFPTLKFGVSGSVSHLIILGTLPSPGSHLWGPRSRVPPRGPGSRVNGLGSHFSGMLCLTYNNHYTRTHVISSISVSMLGLGLHMTFQYHLFFIFSLIFTAINHLISLKQTHLFFLHFLILL